ncbi:8-oxo-dGTP diphosphatase [Gulosibacter molinativorax]|uniref:Oxidized purine nucleoside triphosphate hydrolase n=1 Tax=Gulosibacter molinativorax TaxID=256821 RepID=A0ABT7C7P4_9MICO|nr:NUDIX domain-containing protein [Gulosibacter molinativorax]MDJ1371213.1 NUDIX domain-containing protein [Gulosibacter molinativorax]QUY63029.1 8-oxo-dGTP diphosphatase [Gulosibacter molinativorax]
MALPQVCVTYLLRESSRGTQVLLGRKKYGLGEGKLVGLGGKLHPGEHPRYAAIREIEEESSVFVDPKALQHTGLLTYIFPTKPSWSQESWVYLCRDWIGHPIETEELVPEWHPLDDAPLARMWSDAQYWLPRALQGNFIRASYIFGHDLDTAVASDDPSTGLPSVPPQGTLG